MDNFLGTHYDEKYIKNELRFIITFLMIFNVIATLIFSTLRNPFETTISMIGNRFEDYYLIYFIAWALFFAGSIYFVIMKLFDAIGYFNVNANLVLKISSVLLVIVTLIPAKLEMPFWRWVHIVFSGIYVVMLTGLLHSFSRILLIHRKGFRIFIDVWYIATWIGSVGLYFILGHNGIYEIWFLINVPLILLFLSHMVYQNVFKCAEQRN